jgi:hypothetical protein
MLFEMVTSMQRQPVRTLGGVVMGALQTVFQIALLLLMVLGIGCLFYKAVGPDGLLREVFESAWNRGPMYLFFVTMGILAGGTWLRNFMYRSPSVSSFTGDAMAAVFIGAGIFFCVQIINGGVI